MDKHSFILRAKEGRNQWWIYGLVLIMVIVGMMIISGVLGFLLLMIGAERGAIEGMTSINPDALGIHPALALGLLLSPFVISLLLLWLGVQALHKRSFLSLFSPVDRLDWGKFLLTTAIWFGLMAVFEAVGYWISPDNYQWVFEPEKFFPTLLVVLLLIPFQTTFEEVLFRGYLLQGFGLWFKRPWVAVLIPSLFFGLLHIANPEIEIFGMGILFYYVSFGVLMGILTVMDERIEIALGVHAGNNIFGATVVTFSGSALETPTLFLVDEYHLGLMTAFWLAGSVIFVFIINRMYGWSGWNKLWERIDTDAPETYAGEVESQTDYFGPVTE